MLNRMLMYFIMGSVTAAKLQYHATTYQNDNVFIANVFLLSVQMLSCLFTNQNMFFFSFRKMDFDVFHSILLMTSLEN